MRKLSDQLGPFSDKGSFDLGVFLHSQIRNYYMALRIISTRLRIHESRDLRTLGAHVTDPGDLVFSHLGCLIQDRKRNHHCGREEIGRRSISKCYGSNHYARSKFYPLRIAYPGAFNPQTSETAILVPVPWITQPHFP